MANRWGKSGNSSRFYFLGLQKSLWMVTLATKLKDTIFGRKAMTNLDSVLKIRDIILLTKVHIVKAMVFPVVLYGCECWTIKKAECRRIDGVELWCWRRLFKSPLDSNETKLVNNKGNQPWIFIGRTDAKAEIPVLWPPDVKRQLTGKDSDAGEDWEQEKGSRGWDGWMASLTQWTGVGANSGR